MASPLRRALGLTAGLATLLLTLVAAGPSKNTIEIFVVTTHGSYISEATITIAYDGGGDFADVEGPNPHARFDLPKGVATVTVGIEAAGFCPETYTIQVDGRSHVGGKGYFLYVYPCTSR